MGFSSKPPENVIHDDPIVHAVLQVGDTMAVYSLRNVCSKE